MNGILLNQTIDLTKTNVLEVLNVLSDDEIKKLFNIQSKVADHDYVDGQIQTKADKTELETLKGRVSTLESAKITLDNDTFYESVSGR